MQGVQGHASSWALFRCWGLGGWPQALLWTWQGGEKGVWWQVSRARADKWNSHSKERAGLFPVPSCQPKEASALWNVGCQDPVMGPCPGLESLAGRRGEEYVSISSCLDANCPSKPISVRSTVLHALNSTHQRPPKPGLPGVLRTPIAPKNPKGETDMTHLVQSSVLFSGGWATYKACCRQG